MTGKNQDFCSNKCSNKNNSPGSEKLETVIKKNYIRKVKKYKYKNAARRN